MKKLQGSQEGLAHILLAIIVIVVGVIALVGWRVLSAKDDSKTVTQTATSVSEDDISLQNLGLASLDDVDITENAVREYADKGLKGFYVFADSLSGGRLNPNFEYASLKPGTEVVSAIDGVVGFIKEQPDSGDTEVFIQPREGSMWTIGYDHLTNVTVKKGQLVKAGDVLGQPAVQNNGLLRFEIQVNKDENGTTIHHCPSTLLSPTVQAKQLSDLEAMQNSWNAKTGLDLYNPAAQNPIGCLRQTLTPQEAEGR